LNPARQALGAEIEKGAVDSSKRPWPVSSSLMRCPDRKGANRMVRSKPQFRLKSLRRSAKIDSIRG
jgi:hypothetical protein